MTTNELSMLAFWRAYGLVPGGTLREAADHVLMVSGVPHPLFNGVHQLQPAGAESARNLVQEVQRAVDAAGVPLFFWAQPEALRRGLGGALAAAGAVAVGSCPAMRVEISRLPATVVPGLEIREMGEGEFALWAEIAALGTDLPPDVVQALVAREPHIALDGRRRRYLGFLGDRPVASACTVEAEGVAGVFAIAVLPEFRRRGLGAALTVEPLRRCAARGLETAMLQASPMGFPVYQRLGFETIGEFELHLLEPRA